MSRIIDWLRRFTPFKGKKSVSAKEKRERVRAQTIKKLKLLSGQKNKADVLNELTVVLRQFFKNYFGIRYAFTSEELSDELTRRRIDPYLKRKAKKVLARLNEVEYFTDHNDEELETLLQDINELVELL